MTAMGGEDPRLRARDVDRDFTAGLLRDASVDGQLTVDEFEQRLVAARQAKTVGELARLTADLQNAPADPRPVPAVRPSAYVPGLTVPQGPMRTQQDRNRTLRLYLLLVVIGIVVAIALSGFLAMLGWSGGGESIELPPEVP